MGRYRTGTLFARVVVLVLTGTLVLGGAPARAAAVTQSSYGQAASFTIDAKSWKGSFGFRCDGAAYWETLEDSQRVWFDMKCSNQWLSGSRVLTIWVEPAGCDRMTYTTDRWDGTNNKYRGMLTPASLEPCGAVTELCYVSTAGDTSNYTPEAAGKCVALALGVPPDGPSEVPGGAGCPGTPSKIQTGAGWDWKPRPGDSGRYSAQGTVSFTVTPGIEPDRAGSMYWWVALWSGDASNWIGANVRRMIPAKWTFAEYGQVDVTIIWGEVDVLPGGNTIDIPVSVGRSTTQWGTSVVLGAGIGFSSIEDEVAIGGGAGGAGGPNPHPEYAPPTAPDGLGMGFVGWNAPEHCYWAWGLKWFDRPDTDYDDPLGPIGSDPGTATEPPEVYVGDDIPTEGCPVGAVCVEFPDISGDDPPSVPDPDDDSCDFSITNPSTWGGQIICALVAIAKAIINLIGDILGAIGKVAAAIGRLVADLLAGLGELLKMLFVPDAAAFTGLIDDFRGRVDDSPVGDWADAFTPTGAGEGSGGDPPVVGRAAPAEGGCKGPAVDIGGILPDGVTGTVEPMYPFDACGESAETAALVRQISGIGLTIGAGFKIFEMIMGAFGAMRQVKIMSGHDWSSPDSGRLR